MAHECLSHRLLTRFAVLSIRSLLWRRHTIQKAVITHVTVLSEDISCLAGLQVGKTVSDFSLPAVWTVPGELDSRMKADLALFDKDTKMCNVLNNGVLPSSSGDQPRSIETACIVLREVLEAPFRLLYICDAATLRGGWFLALVSPFRKCLHGPAQRCTS